MARMTGGQALVKQLHREGIRVVFGLPGMGHYEALDALYEEPDIRYIATRHEQATSYMADGYARAGGGIAATLVVQGPGAFNSLAGIATAFAASSPMLVVTGNRHFQHAEPIDDQSSWIRPLVKWTAQIAQPDEVPVTIHEAFRRLKSGRPRPVEIQIGQSTLAAIADVGIVAAAEVDEAGGDPALLLRAARMLADAERPAIWVGASAAISNASAQVQELAEHLQAPVVSSRDGKGTLSDRHPLSLGMAELRYDPLRKWLQTRDVILAVGARVDGSTGVGGAQVIRIDFEVPQVGSSGRANLDIPSHPGRALQQLARLVTDLMPARSVRNTEARVLNAQRFDPRSQLQPQWDFMQAIRSAIPDDGILAQDMTQMGYYSRNYYPVYAPRTYLSASDYGTLGCAFPIALGAKVARPEKAVVALVGDGGFLYNAQELATAAQYKINVVTIVFNDNAYGNVLRAQIEEFDGRVIGTRLHNPDFVRLSEAYGVPGVRVQSAEQLESALRQALSGPSPAVIEVPVGMMERVY